MLIALTIPVASPIEQCDRKTTMSGRSDICRILHIPDNILIDIIRKLNARERVAFGRTCKTLNSLVFNERKFLRDLDFSEEGYLTSASDVEKYLEDEAMLEHVRKLNVSSIYCPSPENLLRNITKATNLVEVNVTGLRFKDFKEFGKFLEPLKQLKKLSSDWPTGQRRDSPYEKYLSIPFGKLTHLSLTLYDALDKRTLLYSLQLCLELEELRVLEAYQYPESKSARFRMDIPDVLDKLRLVICWGAEIGVLDVVVTDMLPDPDQWARSHPLEAVYTRYFYFEKGLEVCEELKEDVPVIHNTFNWNMRGWYLWQQGLLNKVLEISPRIEAQRCSFLSHYSLERSCLMRIEDAKLLLKNPRHQITYLNLPHDIDPDCDVHLIAQHFPRLTKLVLSNVIRDEDFTMEEEAPLETGSKRKRAGSEELDESTVAENSAFKKLVDNTQNLEDLILYARSLVLFDTWDLGALYFIGGWKNLKTLWLANVPITDGEFLVEIGKRCVNLEKLRLEDLGPATACCYKDDLIRMLPHCRNLKDFSIQQKHVDQVFHIFDALAGNPKLRRVRVESLGKKKRVGNLISSVEKLTRSCNLILLICEIKGMTEMACSRLASTLQRLKEELNRPSFQFDVLWWKGAKEPRRNFALDFAHKDLVLSHRFNDAIYRLDL